MTPVEIVRRLLELALTRLGFSYCSVCSRWLRSWGVGDWCDECHEFMSVFPDGTSAMVIFHCRRMQLADRRRAA